MKYGEFTMGPFEEIILRAVLAPCTGEAIKSAAESRLGRAVDKGALYIGLRRLAAKGYVTHNRTRPRNYSATSSGKAAIEAIDDSRL